jgi:hypothetical protein
MVETKPSFSPADRTLLPVLASEDSNPVIEAFRQRRKHHSRRWRFAIPSFQGSSLLVRIVIVFLAIFGSFFVFGMLVRMTLPFLTLPGAIIVSLPVTGLIVAFLAMVCSWAVKVSNRMRALRRVIPRRAGDMFSGRKRIDDLVVELWLAGICGGKIAEAMLLEGVEGFKFTGRLASCLVIPFLVLFIAFRSDLSPVALIMCASMIWLAWSARGLPLWALANLTRGSRIRAVLSEWESAASAHPLARSFAGGVLSGILYFFLAVGGAVFFLFGVVVIGLVFNVVERWEWWPLKRWEFFPLMGTLVFISLGLIAPRAIRWLLKRKSILLQRDISRADAAFDAYVRQALIRDSDGSR